ncbi:MAG: hypothetical protein ABIT08_09090 [Bacteroidia bacterium]
MALPAINIIFTPVQLAAIDAALDALQTNCPFRVNIPANDKNDEQSMNVKRYPYVKNVIENYAPANPGLQPSFLPLADAQNDMTLYDQFSPRIQRIASILESYIDTQWLGGTEGYTYFREFYAVVERAKNNNVPGADAIYNDLKRLYEDQGGPPPVP